LPILFYKDNEGKPWDMPILRSMDKGRAADQKMNHERLPVLGHCRHEEHLKQKCHIYLTKSGRINMYGLTSKSIHYVGQIIHETVLKIPKINPHKE
jgi:aspartate/tyrosine/aromatic aminotransferase